MRTVEDWSRPHIGFRHPEGAFDVVELVVKTHDISTTQLLLGNTRVSDCLCAGGLGLQVVRESVGVSHG
ncbi:Uncharacterised protein [Corynebacterium diphtheriae]|nr:Uncharacterised protein [Corynebacterium diphtheriae]